MNKITSILSLLALLPFLLHGQDSRGHVLLDSMQRTYAGTPDSIHIKNLYRLIDMSKEDGEDELYALGLTYLGPLLVNAQDYAAFENINKLSLEIAKDTTVVSKKLNVSILNNSAFLESLKGNYIKSNMIYLDALELQKEASNDTFTLSTIYNNIATSYTQLGDYENAYQNSLQQLKCVQNSNSEYFKKYPKEQNLYISIAHYTIGDNLNNHKKYSEAKKSYLKSVAYLLKYKGVQQEQKSRNLIDSYIYLAEISIKLSLYQEANNYLNKIIKLQENNSYKLYYTLELNGLLHYSNKRYESAIQFYNQALKIGLRQRSDNKLFPTIARIRMRLGDSYHKQDSLQKAIFKYHSGLKFFDNELDSDLTKNPNIELVNANSRCFEILHKKAKSALDLFRREGESATLKIAKKTYVSLLSLIDKMKASYLKDGSKYYVTELAQEVYDDYLDLLFEMQNKKETTALNQEIINLMEKNKASILFSSIEKKYAFLSSNLPPELIEEEQTLRTDIAFYTKELKTLKSKSGSSTKIKTTEEKLFELSERYAILDNQLKSDYPEFYALTQNQNDEFKIEAIQAELKTDQLFIEYYESDDYIYAFSISKNKTHFYRQEKSREIEEAIDGYFTYASTLPSSKSIDYTTAVQYSDLIYSNLLAPILEIHNNTHQLLVVLDGKLSKIPLESLLIKTSEATQTDYFIKTHDVAYFYSIRQMLAPDSQDMNEELTVLGLAPVFEGEQGESRSCNTLDLKALPFAQEELNYLDENFEGTFLRDQYATNETLLKNMGDYSVIHLATHACLNNEEPMLSQIHMADGTLTNYDIMNLNINPDLVVLSACNTAQGNIKEGEGIISLSRGFFEAGVKSLQSSLWEMNDYSSSKIVQGMYGNLKKGDTKSNALRKSKLSYLESAEKLGSHPYFWAGMIQIGNDEAIIQKKNHLTLILIGVSVLVFLLYRKLSMKKLKS